MGNNSTWLRARNIVCHVEEGILHFSIIEPPLGIIISVQAHRRADISAKLMLRLVGRGTSCSPGTTIGIAYITTGVISTNSYMCLQSLKPNLST